MDTPKPGKPQRIVPKYYATKHFRSGEGAYDVDMGGYNRPNKEGSYEGASKRKDDVEGLY